MPYQYATDGVNYAASNILLLAVGNNNLYVKDNNGCVTQKTIVATLNKVIIANTTNTPANYSTTIPAGSITITANNGTPPNQYSLNANGGYQTSNRLAVFVV